MTPEEQIKFNNYSRASKLRQSLIPKAQRIATARKAARALHASKTPAERRALALKMVAGRSYNKLHGRSS